MNFWRAHAATMMMAVAPLPAHGEDVLPFVGEGTQLKLVSSARETSPLSLAIYGLQGENALQRSEAVDELAIGLDGRSLAYSATFKIKHEALTYTLKGGTTCLFDSGCDLTTALTVALNPMDEETKRYRFTLGEHMGLSRLDATLNLNPLDMESTMNDTWAPRLELNGELTHIDDGWRLQGNLNLSEDTAAARMNVVIPLNRDGR